MMEQSWRLQLARVSTDGAYSEIRLDLSREIAELIVECIKRGERSLAAEDEQTGQVVQLDWSDAEVVNIARVEPGQGYGHAAGQRGAAWDARRPEARGEGGLGAQFEGPGAHEEAYRQEEPRSHEDGRFVGESTHEGAHRQEEPRPSHVVAARPRGREGRLHALRER